MTEERSDESFLYELDHLKAISSQLNGIKRCIEDKNIYEVCSRIGHLCSTVDEAIEILESQYDEYKMKLKPA